jgi:hypothetical protein
MSVVFTQHCMNVQYLPGKPYLKRYLIATELNKLNDLATIVTTLGTTKGLACGQIVVKRRVTGGVAHCKKSRCCLIFL